LSLTQQRTETDKIYHVGCCNASH